IQYLYIKNMMKICNQENSIWGVQKSAKRIFARLDKGKNTSFGLIFTLLAITPEKVGDIQIYESFSLGIDGLTV
ncbi:MAG: hypothetical protein ACE5G1_16245, partial [bacterium]